MTNETMKDGERAAFDVALDALDKYQRNWDSGLHQPYAQSARIEMESAVEAVREALEEARADSPQTGKKGGQWIERWHGSEPFRGWSIFAGRERIAFIGSDESLGEAVSEIIEAHNRVAAPQAALDEIINIASQYIQTKYLHDFTNEVRALLNQAPTERMSDAEEAAGLIGPAMVEHEFSVSPSSGIEICLHCGISKVAARTNTICDEASIAATKEYS